MVKTETRLEPILAEEADTKNIHLKSGLLTQQRFTCANHNDEEVILEPVGWQGFSCPKCHSDYSIGRKIAVFHADLCEDLQKHMGDSTHKTSSGKSTLTVT